MNYDALGRMEWRDVSDQNGNTLSHETFYYDGNGELQWYDGPRSNPDDYIYFSYDGAGRTLQKIHWRTQAKPDGTGIQAIPGTISMPPLSTATITSVTSRPLPIRVVLTRRIVGTPGKTGAAPGFRCRRFNATVF